MRKAFARIVALLAIGGCAAAIYIVVQTNLRHHNSPTTTTTTTPSTSGKHKKHHYTLYTVKAGDVLSQIAVKHHVSLAQIKRLNPHLDAQRLHAGQHIHLR